VRNTKVYISGKISGLSDRQVQAKFQRAEDMLVRMGFEVVNPTKNGLTPQHEWNQHMLRDIELLLPCDSIYMLNDWIASTGASIEHDIAFRTGKTIWFESRMAGNYRQVTRIQEIIHEVTGLKLSEYATESRRRDRFFARMLFVYHCRQASIDREDILQYVGRRESTASYLLKKYGEEVQFNPEFAAMADRVNELMYTHVRL
jgi:hypothetical protein